MVTNSRNQNVGKTYMQIHYAFEENTKKAKQQANAWQEEGCNYVCIFGTGKFGITDAYLYITQVLQLKVDFFCDNDPKKWNLEYTQDKIRCISPQELAEKSEKTVCFICLLNQNFLADVARQLMTMKIAHIIPITDSDKTRQDKEIIIQFQGGLGNQMFQYAFYKKLEIKYPSIKIKADINSYNKCKYHYGFELTKIFNINLDTVSKWEAIRARIEYEQIKEIRGLNFQDNYSNLINVADKKSYYLSGFWCNKSYFFDIKEFLLSDFQVSQCLYNNPIIDDMTSKESVSVHLRRGDFVDLGYALTLDYYKKAVDYILNKVKSPFFYIFSDDIEYANDFFAFLSNKYIVEDNQGDNSYKDMLFMSKCKHNIMANSTFSFWSSYLNGNKDKIVIAPSSFQHLSSKDWIMIPV